MTGLAGAAGGAPARGSVAPLVRRALELLPAGGPLLEELLLDRLPEAMRSRLEPGGLAARSLPPPGPGQSAVVVVSGPGIGGAELAVVLHADGAGYTIGLCAPGRRLPPGLDLADASAGAQPAPPAPADAAGRAWIEAAVATLTRAAADLTDDHGWWGDLGGLIMLAELLEG